VEVRDVNLCSTPRREESALTKLAAKATELCLSRHSSESLNFFSNSSDPIALAAIDIWRMSSCRRRKTRIREPSKTSVIWGETKEAEEWVSGEDDAGEREGRTYLANLRELGTVAPREDGVHELGLERGDVLLCSAEDEGSARARQTKREVHLPSTRGSLDSMAIFAIRLAASCITLKGPASSSLSLLVCSLCGSDRMESQRRSVGERCEDSERTFSSNTKQLSNAATC